MAHQDHPPYQMEPIGGPSRWHLFTRLVVAAVATLYVLAGGVANAAVSDGFDFPLADGTDPNAPRITQRYCENRPGRGPHLGVDWGPRSGTPVHAISNGSVVRTSGPESFGNLVVLRHDLPSGETWYSLYAHLREPTGLREGQQIKRRERIGRVGSTGESTGPHLHLAVSSSPALPRGYGRPCPGAGGTVDPVGFIKARRTLGVGRNYQTAFHANDGRLWVAGPDTRALPYGMKRGTSPAITSIGGSFQAAFHGGNGNLWSVGSVESRDLPFGMAPSTSPAVAALSGGGYQMAFQANDGNLWLAGRETRKLPYGMKAGTSPAITAVAGGYQVAFQGSNGSLWSVGSVGSRDLGYGMKGGTSPAITHAP